MFERFRADRGKDIHQGFTAATTPIPETAQFTINLQSGELDSLLSTFEQNDTQRLSPPSWTEVQESIQTTLKTYADKGSNNWVKGFLRNGKDFVGFLDMLKDLIPDEKGLSVLKWGLSLVFQTWMDRIKNVERIVRVLADIPYLLARVVETWRIYQNDDSLTLLAWQYYGATLDVLKTLSDILLRRHQVESKDPNKSRSGLKHVAQKAVGTFKDAAKALINVDGDEVTNAINLLAGIKSKVEDRVVYLSRQSINDIRSTTGDIHLISRSQEAKMDNLGREMQGIRGELKDISVVLLKWKEMKEKEALQESRWPVSGTVPESFLGKTPKNHAQATYDEAQRMKLSLLPFGIVQVMQTGLYYISSEDIYIRGELEASASPREFIQFPMRSNGWQSSAQWPSGLLTIEKLLEVLDVDPQVSLKDGAEILRHSHSMSSDALSHVSAALSEPAFKEWLRIPAPRTLLIEGDTIDMSTGRSSPLSVFCASLSTSLAQGQTFIVLDYFCGWHSNRMQQGSGPRGLIRSLISQLLQSPNKTQPSLDFITIPLLDGIRRSEPLALCQVLLRLLHQIPSGTTVFCIIDGICEYESQESWCNDIALLIRNLRGVMSPDPRFPCLKLLLVSDGRSRLAQGLEPRERLFLSRQTNAHNVMHRGFNQQIRQVMPERNASAPLLAPPTSAAAGSWMQSNASWSNLQKTLHPGLEESQRIQRVHSAASLR